MNSEERLRRAEDRALRARDRLVADVIAIRNWLRPGRLLRRLTRTAKASSERALEAGTEAVMARPGLVIGALAVGVLVLARKPVARALSPRPAETPAPPTRSPLERASRAPVKRTSRAGNTRKAKS